MQRLPNRWANKGFARVRVASFSFDDLEVEDLCIGLFAEVGGVVAIIYYKVQFIAAITVYVDDSFIRLVAVRILRVQEA
jgi:hypothetical protein